MALVSTLATAPTAPESSRLVRYLQELVQTEVAPSHKNFADKLGRLIDLTDSIYLADALRGISRLSFEPAASTVSSCRGEFMQARQSMVEFIGRSFNPGASALPFSLPQPDADTLLDATAGFPPYQKFYALHQSEMDFRIIKLRLRVRQTVAAHSRQLAQLAALDAALGDTLAAHGRKSLAAIPRLLGVRFQYLRQQYQQALSAAGNLEQELEQWSRPDGWLGKFYQEMQGLLLAELEVRLQPVLGLVEALDAEVATTQ